MGSTSLPPPLRGWNAIDALSDMPVDCAVTLDNMLPTAGGVAVRAGFRRWATGMPAPVTGLLTYRSAAMRRLFAASGSNLYDATTPGAVASPVVGGLTSPYVDGVQMNAAGGDYLLAFNGADPVKVFDGSGWTTWTATDVPDGVSWACNHKGRLWVGDSVSMSAWYGAPGAYTGPFVEFPIRGVARRGGGIIGMSSWTVDGGNGPDDVAAFWTAEGEVLVYSGLDPGSADTWQLQGRFDLPRPIGRRFLRHFGSDVLALTEGGIFTLSQLLSGVDASALAAKALTRQVEQAFRDMSRGRGTLPGWELVSLPAQSIWMINAPWASNDAQQIAFDGATGAPGRFLGLSAACWIEANGDAYFGHAGEGSVCLFGRDKDDAGAAIASEAVQAFSAFGQPGVLKRFTLAAPALGDAALAAVRISMALDWIVPMPEGIARGPGAPPLVPTLPGSAGVWDTSNWNEALWAGQSPVARSWRSVQGIGTAGAVRLQLLSIGSSPLWVGTTVVTERGGTVG